MISYDTPFSEYLRMPGVHFGALVKMDLSPLHYLRARDHEREDTAALRLGRLAHALILTPELVDVAVFDGSARRGKAWEEFRREADANGKLIVKAEELRAAQRMGDAVYENPHARELLRDGYPEVTVTWDEPVDATWREGSGEWHAQMALPCRARLDYLGPDRIVEIKTTRRWGPRSWAREVAARHYHVQLAHYRAGIEASGYDLGEGGVYWIVVENVPPHDVAVYRVRREDIEAGERLRLTWLRRVAECEASGRWPGVGGEGPLEFVLPEYAAGLDDVEVEGLEGQADGSE